MAKMRYIFPSLKMPHLLSIYKLLKELQKGNTVHLSKSKPYLFKISTNPGISIYAQLSCPKMKYIRMDRALS